MTVQDSLRISWRGLPRSGALEAFIHARAAQLDVRYPFLTACHVVIEAPSPRHRQTGRNCVSIDVRALEHQIIVNREHDDAGSALREAFDGAARKLETVARRDRGMGEVPVIADAPGQYVLAG
jgi:ribosome-associated translation inhibitor RaiA